MSLIKNLNWRYATKNMDGKSVSEEKLEIILEAINLSASSFGLQPYRVTVVNNMDIKLKLQEAAYGQVQVGSSSHVLVFSVPKILTETDVQTFINNVAITRSIPMNFLDGYKNSINGKVSSMSAVEQQNWSAKQAYIALGNALAAAAEQEIDACPMEGFNTDEFDKILGLDKIGQTSVVILPIGFRAETDTTSHYAKVRKPKEEMFNIVA